MYACLLCICHLFVSKPWAYLLNGAFWETPRHTAPTCASFPTSRQQWTLLIRQMIMTHTYEMCHCLALSNNALPNSPHTTCFGRLISHSCVIHRLQSVLHADICVKVGDFTLILIQWYYSISVHFTIYLPFFGCMYSRHFECAVYAEYVTSWESHHELTYILGTL